MNITTDDVKQIIADQLYVTDWGQFTLDTKLHEDLGADSLDKAELILALEQKLGRTIPDEQADAVRTVGDLFKLVGAK